jgi:hypothetical protein
MKHDHDDTEEIKVWKWNEYFSWYNVNILLP